MNLDRNDIKMSTFNITYYYDKNNVTVELSANLNTPLAMRETFGYFFVTVKATARCHEDDEYSRKTGEKIALARAESKAYRLLSNELERRWNTLNDALTTLKPIKTAFQEKADNSIEHNLTYCKNLVK